MSNDTTNKNVNKYDEYNAAQGLFYRGKLLYIKIMTSEQRLEYNRRFENIYKNCLFRYRSISGETNNRFTALESDCICFSLPNTFNDPYDNLIYADISTILSHIYENLEKGMSNYLKDIKSRNSFAAFLGDNNWCGKNSEEFLNNYFDMIDQIVIDVKKAIRRNSRVICFSEVYSSMLMWSHYTNDHQGYVLIYDKDDLKMANRYAQDGTKLDNKICLEKVEYVSRQFDLTDEIEDYVRYEVLETMGDVEVLDGRIPKYKLRQAITEKSEEWSYEKEWRLIPRIIDLNRPSPLSYIECAPRGIILGAHCQSSDSEALITIGKGKGIPIYRMFLDKYSPAFKLIIGEAENAVIA